MFKFFLSFLVLLAMPSMALAASFTNVEDLILSVGRLVEILLPLVVALALLFFFWGLAKFVLEAGNEIEKQKGKDLMIWGVVALFVMVSVWGIVDFVIFALDIDNNQNINIPTINFSNSSAGS